MNRRCLTLAVLALAAGLAACDEETLTGPGFICDISNPVRDVFLTPASALVLVHSPAIDTDTVRLQAVATNRFGQARANAPISFSSSDTSIATVDSLGVVHARRPGTVKITANSCGESSSSQVTVIANVAKVTITPTADTVVAGDSTGFTARAFGPDGARVQNVVFTFTSTNSSVRIVRTSDSTATVVSGAAAGTATITATGEGASANATLLILPRVFLAGVASSSGVDGGDDMICGLISNGQGYCWGLNSLGQLGAEVDSTCYPGVELTQTLGEDTVIVTNKPCSLNPVRAGPEFNFSAISAGDSTACGLTADGKAYCWGMGLHGEIGNGNVENKDEPSPVGSSLNFTSISVGGSHVCALAAGGLAYCWGNDLDGQLGDARLVHSTTPIPVIHPDANPHHAVFASISAGFRHTCGLTSTGAAWCWGNNDYGQLGAGVFGGLSSYPVPVATSLSFQSISSGGDHTCGITTGGAAYCWGSNLVGQLGTGGVGGASAVPVAVAGGLTFSRISASSGSALINPKSSPAGLPFKVAYGHTCALTTGGAIYCWGDNRDLQLGQGPYTSSSGTNGTPTVVLRGEMPGNVTFVSVTTGVRNGCGVGSDGNAYCWGSNIYGALGNTLQAAFRGEPQRVATPR